MHHVRRHFFLSIANGFKQSPEAWRPDDARMLSETGILDRDQDLTDQARQEFK